MGKVTDNPYAPPQAPGTFTPTWQPGVWKLILALAILWLWQIPFAFTALGSELGKLWNVRIPRYVGLAIAVPMHFGLSWFFAFWITQQNRSHVAAFIVVPSTLVASVLMIGAIVTGFYALEARWPDDLPILSSITAVGLIGVLAHAFSRVRRQRDSRKA